MQAPDSFNFHCYVPEVQLIPSWNGFIKQEKFEKESERVEIAYMANVQGKTG
jgi:hypothetical protein